MAAHTTAVVLLNMTVDFIVINIMFFKPKDYKVTLYHYLYPNITIYKII